MAYRRNLLTSRFNPNIPDNNDFRATLTKFTGDDYKNNIAANIDQAVIVMTHAPSPIEHYIDRYLAALHNNNIANYI